MLQYILPPKEDNLSIMYKIMCPLSLHISCILLSLQKALKEAKESLDHTMRILNEAKSRLKEVEDGIAELQIKFEETMKKKEELKEKCDLCTSRLERAEKVHVHVHVYGK